MLVPSITVCFILRFPLNTPFTNSPQTPQTESSLFPKLSSLAAETKLKLALFFPPPLSKAHRIKLEGKECLFKDPPCSLSGPSLCDLRAQLLAGPAQVNEERCD